MAEEIDRPRVEALVRLLIRPVRDELARPPLTTDNVFVVLNGVAIVLATVLAGTGHDEKALVFFQCALNEQLDDLRENPPS